MPLNNKSTSSKKQSSTEKVEISALTSLLKSLDNRLSNLDNNSNSHIKFISDTFKWTENVINYCKNIEKQISDKEEKKKNIEKNNKFIISEQLNNISKIKTRNTRNTIGFSKTNTELKVKINPIHNNNFFISRKSFVHPPPKNKILKTTKSTTNLNQFKNLLISNNSLNKNINNNNSNKSNNKNNENKSNKIVKNKITHRKSLVLTQRPTLKSSRTIKNLNVGKRLVNSVIMRNKKKKKL